MTESEIENMIYDIIDVEDEYVDHPDDRGGPTKYGVTLKTFQDFNKNENLTKEDLKKITEQDAYIIYEKEYYYRPNIHKLPIELQHYVLDCSIHHGPYTAIVMLQEVVNHMHDENVLQIDGNCGKYTIRGVEHFSGFHIRDFFEELINKRLARFDEIVERDPTQGVFLDGWKARAEAFRPEDKQKQETSVLLEVIFKKIADKQKQQDEIIALLLKNAENMGKFMKESTEFMHQTVYQIEMLQKALLSDDNGTTFH